MWTLWWVWMTAALCLAILEVLVPGYIFLGFALGAAVTGLTLLIGGSFAVTITGSIAWLLVFFAVVSIVAWVALRRVLGVRSGQVKIWHRDINED